MAGSGLELFSITFSVVILISLGFVAKKSGLLKAEDASILNNIIIYLTLPAMIFEKVLVSTISLNLWRVPVTALVVMSVCLFVALLVGKGISLKAKTLGAFLLAAAIGNTGYLGYPISLEIYGSQHFIKALFYDIFGTVIFIFTIGLYVAEVYGEEGAKINRLKEILTFPPLIALVAGILLRGFSLPPFLVRAIEHLGAATIPLIMLSIGLSLRLGEVGRYKLPLTLTCLLKLILSPLVAYFIGGAILAADAFSLGVCVLEASMPTVILSLIFGLRYKLDTAFLSAAILLTTLISMVTVPTGQYLLRMAMRG